MEPLSPFDHVRGRRLNTTPLIVIAPDKFKGSLSALEAAEAMAEGVLRVLPQARLDLAPIADGGEGTVEALVKATGGRFLSALVMGPMLEPVTATYGLLGDGQTAVIEMASASGLVLVPRDQRDPAKANTRGVGELMLAAIDSGAKRLILGIGGSATNDGGAGMAQALGYRLFDDQGQDVGPGGVEAGRVVRIDASNRDSRLDSIEILVACDVDNPLCGPRGASAVYGPQKGASPELVLELDQCLNRFAQIMEKDLNVAVRDLPGAGAAGGLGAGLVAFAHGKLQRGIELVLNAINLQQRLQNAQLCLTAEGSIDASTAHGKAIAGVAQAAQKAQCPVFAFAGRLGPGASDVHPLGVNACFSICPGPISEAQAIQQAPHLLANIVEQTLRVFTSRELRANKREDEWGVPRE